MIHLDTNVLIRLPLKEGQASSALSQGVMQALEWRTSLSTGAWDVLVVQSNAEGAATTYTDAAPDACQRFYRVRSW